MTPIDAERAFAADAKAIGQWTAFRKWSTDDAVMFVPQPANAHDFLKDRKDPPKAIDWWPTASWISCDGSLAVNTGGWKRQDGSVGYFTTVWTKQSAGGWKWVLDHGERSAKPPPRPARPKMRKASCRGAPFMEGPDDAGMYGPDEDTWNGGNASNDHTLMWLWSASSDGRRMLTVHVWNGRWNDAVLVNSVVAPPK